MNKGLLAGLVMFSNAIMGQELERGEDSVKAVEMPQIQVVIQRDRLLSKVPGSVAVIENKSIRKIAPVTANELLRKVPGLNLVDEEGAGLRINIGVRGLDPDRSRNVLLLEDGIPVALNPYGEPEMYFSPPIDKVTAVEVLKGSGQILFGPQTTGGVINLITAHPPDKEESMVRLRAGSGGYLMSQASYGNTVGKTGFIVNYLNKRADAIGATRFTLNDLSAKLKIELGERSKIGVNVGFYDEESNSTYIGLTQSMYDRGGKDFVRMAPNDLLPVRRYNFSATHQYSVNKQTQLQTTAFGYTTSRDWRRQDFSSSAVAANRTGIVWGDPGIPGGAVFMQNTNGQRNRQFGVGGVESQLKWTTDQHLLQVGARLLFEKADEQFIVGNKPDAVGGNLRDVELRKGRAISVYAHDKVSLSKKLDLNVGVRLEQFDYTRNILRGRFNVNGVTVVADTNVIASNTITALIPGLGFNYTANDRVSVFGGIHRGFAPPRTKDAITTEGMALAIANEESWNSELGVRAVYSTFFRAELTVFNMDFQNQIIPISQSSGNANATGLANGGRTMHLGLESAAVVDLGKFLKKKYSLVFSSNITVVNSRYAADRFIVSAGNKVNVRNNRLPYAPSLMVNNTIEWETEKGSGIRISGNYVGEQFSDELNTLLPSADGRTGKIRSRYVTDATLFAKLSRRKVYVHLAVKNMTNERYIVSRRPQGIRVGIDRQVVCGAEFRW